MDTTQTTAQDKTVLHKTLKDASSQSKMSNRIDQVLNRIEHKLSELKQKLSSSSSSSTPTMVVGMSSGALPSLLAIETIKAKATEVDEQNETSKEGNEEAKSAIELIKSKQSSELVTTCCASIVRQSQQQPPFVSSLKSKTMERESNDIVHFDCSSLADQLPTDMLKSIQSNGKPIKRVMFADGTRPGDSFDNDKPSTATVIAHTRKRRTSSVGTKRSPLTSSSIVPLVPANHALVPFFGFNLITAKVAPASLHKTKVQSANTHISSKSSKIKSNETSDKRRTKRIGNAYSGIQNDWSDWIDWNQYNCSTNNTWLPYTIDEEAHLLYTTRLNQTFLLGWLINNEPVF